MRKAALLAALLAAFVVGAAIISIAGTKVTSHTKIHVIEHAVSDGFADIGKSGLSPGDILTFHNPVYDANDNKKVAHDLGTCIRVTNQRGSWQCNWTTFWKGMGSISVSGPFYDAKGSTLAITGGTGYFRNARGWMQLKYHNAKGSKYDFVFHVIP
jgi:hypothetical protein